MKKSSLLIFYLFISFYGHTQTVKDYKVPFSYIQLPIEPLNKDITSYDVVFEDDFQQANQDTLAAYNTRLEAAKKEQASLLEIWNKDRLRIDRLYLSEMAVWEKAVNSGNAMVQPVKQPYPDYPLLKPVALAVLTNEVESDYCSSKINLSGYEKGPAGVVITLTHHGFQSAKIVKKISGSASLKRYKYTAHFKMPVQVKIVAPIQGLIYEKNYYFNESTELIKSEKSQYDFQLWWMDNEEKYWKSLQNKLLNNILSNLNSHVNTNYGFPQKSSESEIYVIKKYKDYDYASMVDAMSLAKKGYLDLINEVDKKSAKESLLKAIEIWEKDLEESNLNENKTRINKKSTALLYANLAEAYMWFEDFDKADLYINKAITLGVLKYKNHCKRLQDRMGNLKKRYSANN